MWRWRVGRAGFPSTSRTHFSSHQRAYFLRSLHSLDTRPKVSLNHYQISLSFFSLLPYVIIIIIIAENRSGMVSLYKDMEACAGYADILVMWEMVQSSSLPTNQNTEIRKMPFHQRVIFKPT